MTMAQQDMQGDRPDPSQVTIYTSLDDIREQPDSVYYIDLSKQKLKTIPEEIFLCKNLVYLDLKRNKIQSIPDNISGLTKLRVLNLSRNKITIVPEEIGACKELRTLILNQNPLESLCGSIGLLNNLAVLDLWGTEVDELPVEISKISENLQFLDMRVIYMTREAQEKIQTMLPETTIYFSNSCNCH